MLIPSNCYLEPEEHIVGDYVMNTLRCIPYKDCGVIRVKAVGGMTKLTLIRSKLAPGVNTHEVHRFNVLSGAIPPDEETIDARQAESRRVSLARAVSEIRELVACNPWRYFVTITLNPEKWPNRHAPDTLQETIKTIATKWRRMQKNKVCPYKDFKYLFIPEQHKDGAIHLHSFITLIPQEYLKQFTLEDIRSDNPLPKYICDTVLAGQEIFHCTTWGDLFGFNIIEPIKDLDRAANYAVMYVTKNLGASPFKCRYWRSHGLQKSSVIETFRIEGSTKAIEEYSQLILPYAAVSSAGEVMHRAFFRPQPSNQSAYPAYKDDFAGIHTMINRDTLSWAEVVELLSQHYPSQAELDSLYREPTRPMMTIEDARYSHESVLDEKAFKQSRVIFYEVDDTESNPFV